MPFIVLSLFNLSIKFKSSSIVVSSFNKYSSYSIPISLHAILLFLVDQMDNYNAVMCSYQVIQEVLGISRATASAAVRVLRENGFIAVLKSGTSNVYAINDTVYWKSWGNKKQYSKFPANIILSIAEQEQSLQAQIKALRHKEVTIKE